MKKTSNCYVPVSGGGRAGTGEGGDTFIAQRRGPPPHLYPSALLPMLFALLTFGGPAIGLAATPEDQWWQYRNRHHRGYVEAAMSLPVSADGEAVEGGTAFALAAGYWVIPWLSTEFLVDLGTVTVGNDAQMQRTEHRGFGGGLRLGLPIYLTPVFAAAIAYRRSHHGATTASRCMDGLCRESVSTPESQGTAGAIVSAEAGLQFNRGPFTASLTVEVEGNLGGRTDHEAMNRGRPGTFVAGSSGSLGPSRLAVLNLRLGMRF